MPTNSSVANSGGFSSESPIEIEVRCVNGNGKIPDFSLHNPRKLEEYLERREKIKKSKSFITVVYDGLFDSENSAREALTSIGIPWYRQNVYEVTNSIGHPVVERRCLLRSGAVDEEGRREKQLFMRYSITSKQMC